MISIVLVVVVILGSLGLVYWMPDLVQETLWEREGQRSFIAHFLSIVLIYALVIELFLSLIVFVSHIIIYPIAHIEKKRILYAAKNKIDAMPCLTTIGIS